jgi:NAD(P)-dependent dehydrogenase (short-subunit alcohol dehydrogenase family)
MEEAELPTMLRHHTCTAEEERALTAQLKDKVVVVTGGSRGLGKAIAEAFAEHEAHVIVASRTRLDSPERGHRLLEWMRVDVTDVDSVSGLEHHIRHTWGTLDILVNNAGTITREQPMLETPVSDLLQVIDVNLKGPLLMSRLLVPLMKDRRGIVINVGSSAGRTLRTGMVPYGTSKAGLRHHSANFAVELAETEGFSGVRVFVVDPGGMDTALRYVSYPEETDKSALAEPKQVAPFFTRLAAGWITTDVETGQLLRSGQELVVKRYLPELWPEGSRIPKGEKQGRLYQ